MIDSVFNILTEQLRQRSQSYNTYLNFYNGVQWKASDPYERKLVVNYCKTNVEKVTSYLMADMSIALDPKDKASTATASTAEAFLKTIHDDNNCEEFDYISERDAAIFGDGCYKVVYNNGRIRVSSPPVTGLVCIYDPEDQQRLIRVISQWRDNNNVPWTEDWTDANFTLYRQEQVYLNTFNPYGFIPFIHYPNLRNPQANYGRSDVADIVELQTELNRALSQISWILELCGNPIAVLENVTGSENIAVRPGQKWELPEGAKAYLLDLLAKGGLDHHMKYLEAVYRAIQDTNETPKAAFGQTERDLSGAALEIEMQPLIQFVRRKRRIRSTVYRRRTMMILALAKQFMNVDYAATVSPRVIWGNILPTDYRMLSEVETQLVGKLIHTRQRAAEMLGVSDTAGEFDACIKERETILKQTTSLGGKAKGAESVSAIE